MDGTLCISTVHKTEFWVLPEIELAPWVARLMVAATVDDVETVIETIKTSGAILATGLSTNVCTLILQRRRRRMNTIYAMRYLKPDNSSIFTESLPVDPARAVVYQAICNQDTLVKQLYERLKYTQTVLAQFGEQAASMAQTAKETTEFAMMATM